MKLPVCCLYSAQLYTFTDNKQVSSRTNYPNHTTTESEVKSKGAIS